MSFRREPGKLCAAWNHTHSSPARIVLNPTCQPWVNLWKQRRRSTLSKRWSQLTRKARALTSSWTRPSRTYIDSLQQAHDRLVVSTPGLSWPLWASLGVSGHLQGLLGRSGLLWASLGRSQPASQHPSQPNAGHACST